MPVDTESDIFHRADGYIIAFVQTFRLELEFIQFLGARQQLSVNVKLTTASCDQVAILGYWG